MPPPRFPPPLPSWANIFVFDTGNTSYTANSLNYYLYVNTNGQNVTITLPSNAYFSKSYNIRKINDSPDILTINTDDGNCFIDGTTEDQVNSILDSVSVTMGPDGNYWSTGGRIIVVSQETQTELFVDISGVAEPDGFYITFINTNYIPIMHSNTLCITIQYDENTRVLPTNNNLTLYF